MALPMEYLNLSPEQQRVARMAALKAYKEAEPGGRRQKAREALMASCLAVLDSKCRLNSAAWVHCS